MRQLLINARDPDLIRVAILGKDRRLEEIDFESPDSETIKGNVYKARVVRVEPALQAAFVDYGAERNGFLPLGEVSGAVLTEIQKKKGRKRTFSDEKLEKGQEILVQVTREAMGPKGAAMTTYVALPGRYLVYLAGGESGGVSRKIDSPEQRAKLNETIRAIKGEKDVGLIVRTAGTTATKTELQKDFRFLEKLWKDIVGQYQSQDRPGLVWADHGTVIRAVRDYYTADVEKIWVDEPETFEEVRRFAELSLSKKVAQSVTLYESDMPLFSHFGVESQLARTRGRKVELPSGGSIVIDQTEALVAIDVNSGKLRGEKGIEDTALKTNCEAAREIARQLRLRNLGGIIVIDFIDMRDRKNRAQVEKELKDAIKPDKANTTLGKIGRFGTLEMLRQRMRTSGASTGFVTCSHCNGSGLVPSPQVSAVSALREIRTSAARANPGAEIRVKLSDIAANYLLNERRAELVSMEAARSQRIVIQPSKELSLESPAIIRIEGGTPAPQAEKKPEQPRRDDRQNQQRPRQEQNPRQEERPRQQDRPRQEERPRQNEERKADSQPRQEAGDARANGNNSGNGGGENGEEQPRKKRRRGSRGGRNRRKRKPEGTLDAAQAGKSDGSEQRPAPQPAPAMEEPKPAAPKAKKAVKAPKKAAKKAPKKTAKKATKKVAKKTPKKKAKQAE